MAVPPEEGRRGEGREEERRRGPWTCQASSGLGAETLRHQALTSLPPSLPLTCPLQGVIGHHLRHKGLGVIHDLGVLQHLRGNAGATGGIKANEGDRRKGAQGEGQGARRGRKRAGGKAQDQARVQE